MPVNNLPDVINDDESVDSTDYITKEMLIGCLPDKRFKAAITDDVVELVNSETNSEVRRVFRDNVLSYSSLLMCGRYSVASYVNAVKFVSLKLLGDINSVAYAKVFPDRYYSLIQKNTSKSQIASFADNYAKNGLVIKILEQAIVPTHILNANIYQEAINTQAELMRDANSEMVRMKAAECLIANLKAPEATKIEIGVNYSNDLIDDLRATTRALAQQQRTLIENRQVNAKDIADSNIFKKVPIEITDVEYTEIEIAEKPHTSLFEGL